MSRRDEQPVLSFKTQMAIAIIGLAGSLGGAWIASGAKFDRELEARGEEIRELRQSLLDAQASLNEQQAKLDKIEGEIELAKAAVAQVAVKAAEITWEKVKGSLSFGNPFSREPKKE